MVKLVASDLDGTLLLNGAQCLNPRIFDIINELKKQGILFVAASGRQYASMRNLFKPIADKISYIAENGAVCVHEGERIFTSVIPQETVKQIFALLQNCPTCKILVSCPDTCYILSGDDEFLHHIRDVVHNDTTLTEDFSTITEPIIKIAVFEPICLQKTTAFLQANAPKGMKVATSGNDWIDFIPTNSNKATALKGLLDMLQIKPSETISFGDQQNDLEMLALTGTSYAMCSAVPEVQEMADHITSSVEEALAEFLNKNKRMSLP